MAQSKHTPGPWEFSAGCILANGEALKVVGVQVPMVVGPSRLEAIHNARLIAAAPELLDLARNIAGLDDGVFTHAGLDYFRSLLREYLDAARAAIAKAEGGAS